MTTAKEMSAYDSGFLDGLKQGMNKAFAMKEDADGCCGCAFEDVNSWEMPCHMCKRNIKDYWRAKKVEE